MSRNLQDYEKNYSNLPFEAYQVKYRRQKVIKLLQENQHETVLEIGCGLHPLCEFVKDVKKWIIVEPADKFYENATTIIGTEDKLIHDFFTDKIADCLVKTDEKIDYIVCSALLHELEQPEQILHAIRKACHKDTIVHINVPNAKSIHRILARQMGLIENEYSKSKTQEILQQTGVVYDEKMLVELCSHNGFEVLQSGSYFIKPFTHEQMQRCMDNNIIDLKLLDGLFELTSLFPKNGSELFVQLTKNNSI